MVLLSDNGDHGKATVIPYTPLHVLKPIKEFFWDILNDIDIWIDGPSTQIEIYSHQINGSFS